MYDTGQTKRQRKKTDEILTFASHKEMAEFRFEVQTEIVKMRAEVDELSNTVLELVRALKAFKDHYNKAMEQINDIFFQASQVKAEDGKPS